MIRNGVTKFFAWYSTHKQDFKLKIEIIADSESQNIAQIYKKCIKVKVKSSVISGVDICAFPNECRMSAISKTMKSN